MHINSELSLETLGQALQDAYGDMEGLDIPALSHLINKFLQESEDIDFTGLEDMLNDLMQEIGANAKLDELFGLISETLTNMSRVDLGRLGRKVSEGLGSIGHLEVGGELGDAVNDGLDALAGVNFGTLGDEVSRSLSVMGEIDFEKFGGMVKDGLLDVERIHLGDLGDHLSDGLQNEMGNINIGDLDETVNDGLNELSQMDFAKLLGAIRRGYENATKHDLDKMGDIIRESFRDDVNIGDLIDRIDFEGSVDFDEMRDEINRYFNDIRESSGVERLRDESNSGIEGFRDFNFTDISDVLNDLIKSVDEFHFGNISDVMNSVIGDLSEVSLTEAGEEFNREAVNIDFDAAAGIAEALEELKGDVIEFAEDHGLSHNGEPTSYCNVDIFECILLMYHVNM